MNYRPPVGMVFAILCLIWGSTFVALKIGLEQTPPILGVAIRNLIASGILLVIIFLKKYKIPTDSLAIKQYLVVGVLNFSFSYSLTYLGSQFIYSNVAALLWASFPILTAILAHITIPGERLNLMKVLGIAVGFAGVSLIFIGYGFGESPNLWLGMTLLMGAVLMGTWPTIYLKKHSSRANPVVLNGLSLGVGGIVTLMISLSVEDPGDLVITPRNVAIMLYLAVFGSVTAWVLYFYLLERIQVLQLSFVGFIAPLVATFMGTMILNEQLPAPVYLGAVLILTGIFLTDFRRYLKLMGLGR